MSAPLPPFIPAEISPALEGKSYSFRLPKAVRDVLRTPERIPVTDHAEKYRQVTDPPHQGPWRAYYAPHTRHIMETWAAPHVREVWYCAPEQGGAKTSTMLNCLHYAAHVAPGDIFYLLPDETSAKKIVSEKIMPLIQQSGCLKETGKADDLALGKIRLRNGVRIFPAWATSPASMAMFAARYAFCDESDKGSELTGREADRITLIRKRLRLYGKLGKGFFASTPAGLFIFRGVYSCPQVWQFRPRCPHCDQLEEMSADGLRGIDAATAEDIESGVVQVQYQCSHCHELWDADVRERAIRAGIWIAIKGADLSRPARVGYHMRAFECLQISLEEIAIAFVKARKGSIVAKIAWANGYLCEDYKQEEGDHVEEYVLRLMDDNVDPQRKRNVCPDNTAAVLLVADAQQQGCWYQVFACSYGADFKITVLDWGYVPDFEGLVAIQDREYTAPSGRKFRAESGWIDSGGGLDLDKKKHSRTAQVYGFCRNKENWRERRQFWHPVKGRQRLELPWQQNRLDFWPSSVGKKIPIHGGLVLTHINTNLWKDELDRRLKIELGEDGCITLPYMLPDEAQKYARQLCAWYRDDRGLWKTIAGRDDHLGDIFVYLLCVADLVGVKNRQPPAVVEQQAQAPEKKKSVITILR